MKFNQNEIHIQGLDLSREAEDTESFDPESYLTGEDWADIHERHIALLSDINNARTKRGARGISELRKACQDYCLFIGLLRQITGGNKGLERTTGSSRDTQDKVV